MLFAHERRFLARGLPASDRWRALLLARGPRIATWALALALGVQAASSSQISPAAAAGTPAARRPTRSVARQPSTSRASPTRTSSARPPPPRRERRQRAADEHAAGADRHHRRQGSARTAWRSSDRRAQTRKGVCSRRQRAGRRQAPFGLHAIGCCIDRNGQLESLTLPRQTQRRGTRRPRPPRSRHENPAVERMRR